MAIKRMIIQYINTLKTKTAKEIVGFDFRLEKVSETRKHLSEEIKYSDLMSENHKIVCRDLN